MLFAGFFFLCVYGDYNGTGIFSLNMIKSVFCFGFASWIISAYVDGIDDGAERMMMVMLVKMGYDDDGMTMMVMIMTMMMII